jgi:crotonobetainyl-CoA:carnitine CoA-transferase CaiB-like acyl-CoA transferase
MPMLSPYRVLDLTDERGPLAAQLLGDLGADVVKVEPPGGGSARHIGPFAADMREPNRSLYFWAYNRNKRGVTLDLESDEGRAILRRLAARADFLVESFAPGHLAARGLGFADLAALNPRLIYLSLSAFGQTGPKAAYADADLILIAAGGPLWLTGDEDRPPVRVSVPQAYLHASVDGVIASLATHHERVRSGLGQHIDVAAQSSLAMATQSGILAAPLGAQEAQRWAGGVKQGPIDLPLVWPARDGYVSLTFLFGSALGVFTRKLMDYVCAEGFCDAATRDKDWLAYGELLASGKEPLAEFERVKDVVRVFTRSRSKAELLALAVERGFLITPITTIAEVIGSPQLGAREYWRPIAHPELGRDVIYPGPFAKFSATPLQYRRRPPLAGEHNREIYAGELGMAESELNSLAARGII